MSPAGEYGTQLRTTRGLTLNLLVFPAVPLFEEFRGGVAQRLRLPSCAQSRPRGKDMRRIRALISPGMMVSIAVEHVVEAQRKNYRSISMWLMRNPQAQ